MTDEQRRMHDKLVQEFTKRGQLMAAGFVSMRLSVIPPDAPKVQVDEMRMAFFAGAQHLFASLMAVLDPGEEPTEADLERISLIAKELETFADEMRLRVAETGRPQ